MMKIKTVLWVNLMVFMISSFGIAQDGKHVFILSGQSNMNGVKPEVSFTPTVEAQFGKENVIVVKNSWGGQPIRRWYKDWKPAKGNEPKAQPDLYDSLMTRVHKAIDKEKILTATFIWMQGERDAREKFGEVYEKSLIGLYEQLSNDIGHDDMNFIIGRLSDFGMSHEEYPHWKVIRQIQVKVAESNPRFDWVNTDDLNDGISRRGEKIKNDLHMAADGYVTMGKRFAETAIQLIKNNE